jgi:hypothetical protein
MWGVLAISIAFVMCGLLLLGSNLPVAIVTIAFFGSCAAVAGMILLRKLRAKAPSPDRVELLGGIALRPSRLLIGGIGAWIGGLGVIMFVFGSQYGLLLLGLGLGMAALGCFILVGIAVGWLPTEYLRFDPSGITLGRRRFAYMIPWDNIAALSTAEINHNPVILIELHQPERIEVTPPERMTQALKELSRYGLHGAHVMLAPVQYRMDASLLVQALDRYVREPHARNELSARLIGAQG